MWERHSERTEWFVYGLDKDVKKYRNRKRKKNIYSAHSNFFVYNFILYSWYLPLCFHTEISSKTPSNIFRTYLSLPLSISYIHLAYSLALFLLFSQNAFVNYSESQFQSYIKWKWIRKTVYRCIDYSYQLILLQRWIDTKILFVDINWTNDGVFDQK